MKKLLITGASGFLGYQLCLMAKDQWNVMGTYYRNPCSLGPIKMINLNLLKTDLISPFIAKVQPDAIIHTAALSNTNYCEQNPEESYQINVVATKVLAQYAADHQIPFVFTSTDLVFDGQNAPYNELSIPNPINVYGAHKYEAEQAIHAIHNRAVICRLPLLFGVSANRTIGAFYQMVHKMKKGNPISLFTDEFRTPSDIISVSEGILWLLAQQIDKGTIHLGGKERISRYDLGLQVKEAFELDHAMIIAKKQSEVKTVAPRQQDASLDSSMAHALGFNPRPISEALHLAKHPLKQACKMAKEKAVLVGIIDASQDEVRMTEYLNELAFLATTAGAITYERFYQKLHHPDPRTFIRKGKLEEIGSYVKQKKIETVIFDDDLTPTQLNNIKKVLRCKVLDRTNLILDIFASRAQTAQARTQVALAQMQYLLPRLKGMWQHLERQKGGIGLRGPGETEIETDRRIVRKKITVLKAKLAKIKRQNNTQRKQRSEYIRVALVGYTNVGKSTLMKSLTKSVVFTENKLFATLDTTVRKVVLKNIPFLLSDTVGFIRKLPHSLIESFHSTLDEVREADILIHVVDISHPNYEDQMAVVHQTLKDLGIVEKKTLVVFNKMDLYEANYYDEFLPDAVKKDLTKELQHSWIARSNEDTLFISAIDKKHIQILKEKLHAMLLEAYQKRYPYKKSFF